MDKNNVEQATVTAQEQVINLEDKAKEQGAERTTVSYGKFKDASALLSAYNALESEFTKRCQRVKELETALSAVDKESPPTPTEEEKDGVLKEYLREVLSKKQRAIVLDSAGLGAKTPYERPKTLEQAGLLAKDLLTKRI